MHLIAVIFAVLVMAPYAAASRHRWLRMLAMCVASVLIYRLAVALVVDGPFGYDSIISYLLSGAGAAMLIGISVVVLVPRRLPWLLPVYCLFAGAIGGAAFEDSMWPGSGYAELGGHLIWQVLVCLALHLGLRPASR
ncbi:MAG: hypothetical protein WD929_06420 [Steroidobacteraceae bacterium]